MVPPIGAADTTGSALGVFWAQLVRRNSYPMVAHAEHYVLLVRGLDLNRHINPPIGILDGVIENVRNRSAQFFGIPPNTRIKAVADLLLKRNIFWP